MRTSPAAANAFTVTESDLRVESSRNVLNLSAAPPNAITDPNSAATSTPSMVVMTTLWLLNLQTLMVRNVCTNAAVNPLNKTSTRRDHTRV